MEKIFTRKCAQMALAAVVSLSGLAGAAVIVGQDTTPAYAAQSAGWKKSGGSWWYAHQGSGYATGWEKIGGKWYLFDGSGWMKTGWQQNGGKWYYLGSDGAMRTGWQKVSGNWYYLKDSGAMATGWQAIGGAWYLLDSSGVMQTGWQKSGGKWYYLNSSGVMQTNKWIQGKYYVDGNGVMATNQWVGSYYVGSDGAWIEGYGENSSSSRNIAIGKWQITELVTNGSRLKLPYSMYSENVLRVSSGGTFTLTLNSKKASGTWTFLKSETDGDTGYTESYKFAMKDGSLFVMTFDDNEMIMGSDDYQLILERIY